MSTIDLATNLSIFDPRAMIANVTNNIDKFGKNIYSNNFDNESFICENVTTSNMMSYIKIIENKMDENPNDEQCSILFECVTHIVDNIEDIKSANKVSDRLLNKIDIMTESIGTFDIDERSELVKKNLHYKSIGINESAFVLDKGFLYTLNESSHLEISKDLMNTKDKDKLFKKIKNLKFLEYIKEVIKDDHDKGVQNFKNLCKFLYDAFINDVSKLRYLAKVLESNDNLIQDLIDKNKKDRKLETYLRDLMDISNQFTKKAQIRANKNLSECVSIEYDVLLELGLEDMRDIEINEVLTEGVIKNTVRKAKVLNKKLSRKLDSKVQRIVDDVRDAKKEEAENKIVKSAFNASTLLKSILKTGAAAAIGGPALALIYLITKIALNKKMSGKTKQRILSELKDEHEIIEEKIKDAEKNNDDKAKYKLMRLKNQVRRSIDKVQYNLKHY